MARRPSSADIVAGANEIRQRTQARIDSNADLHAKEPSGKKGGGWFSRKKKDKNVDDQKDLKAEMKMDEHKITVDELVARFGTNVENGMTESAVEARRREEGENKLTPPAQTPEWVKLLQTQTGFFSLLLWFGAILCFVGFALKNDNENLILGIVLAIVVVATGLFSYYQERKSSDLMNSFKEMMAEQTVVVRDGQSSKLDARLLVRGDIVELKGGDKVPADVRVLSCSDDTKVDNASLTGESEAIKREAKCTHENPLETRNLCFFGTYIPAGSARCMVVNIGDHTVMGRIASLTLQTENVETPIAKEIEHFVRIVSGVAIILGISFFAIGAALGTEWVTNLVFMIGIIVANVPEGLLATVTVCLSLTAKSMASKEVLVKNLEGVETLGSTSCICSDKTGTLTQNIMTVAHLVYDLQIWDVESTMASENFNDKDPSFIALSRCATLCNKAVFDVNSKTDSSGNPVPFQQEVELGDGSKEKRVMWKPIGDASESAMIKFCQSKWDIIKEREKSPLHPKGIIPFNSANKYQVHVHWDETSSQYIDVLKGAPERVTQRCGTILINGEEVPLTAEHIKQIDQLQLDLSRRGMRVLGFAEKRLDPARYPKDYSFDAQDVNFPIGEPDEAFQKQVALAKEGNSEPPSERMQEKLCYIGMMALIDPPRPQVPGAVEVCKGAGIKVIMVTGDHPETAKAISKKVGIIWGETSDDIALRNEQNGLREGMPGWEDPDYAPAIVVPGWDISVDTPEDIWDDILAHPQVVFARTSPQQKLIIVENCQKRGHVVAVTGDGVNDSPALKKADIGIAMGIMGTDVSKEAADMILLDDNFASIVKGIEEGRLIFDNLKKSIAYTLSSNIPEISPFLAFILVQIPLPLSTVLILLVDLGTDMVPAISMAWENPEADIMGRNPRDAAVDRLVTVKLISFAYLQIGVIQALSGFYTYLTVLNDYGYNPKVLPGLGAVDAWGKNTLTCQVRGGAWRNFEGAMCPCFHNAALHPYICGAEQKNWFESLYQRNYVITKCQAAGFVFWDEDTRISYVDPATGTSHEDVAPTNDKCAFPAKNLFGQLTDEPGNWNGWDASTYLSNGQLFTGTTTTSGQPTRASLEALRNRDCPLASQDTCPFYYEYLPYRAVQSAFFKRDWMANRVNDDDTPGLGEKISEAIFFAYQPIGKYTLWEAGQNVKTKTQMGHISDVMDVSTHTTNPNKITKTNFNAGFLDQSVDLPWLSTNELSNTFVGDIVDANFNEATGATSSTAARDMAIALIQKQRCGQRVTGSAEITTTAASELANATSFKCYSNENPDLLLLNTVSRMSQRESLANAQTASFIGIIIVQWADLVICKTRWLSLRSQGMRNPIMNFALVFEVLLGAVLCYISAITAIGTRPLRVTHWFCAMPFSAIIVIYDEIRKYLMRQSSSVSTDKVSGRSVRHPGWLERFTYY